MINKLFFPVAILMLLLAATLWVQIRANGKLESALESKQEEIKNKDLLIAKERTMAAASALMSGAYQEQRRQSNEQIAELERCIADKSCVPRVRVLVEKACPGLPGAATNAGGTETTTAELGPDSQRAYIKLKSDIRLITDRYLWMQKELAARSDRDYCKPIQ